MYQINVKGTFLHGDLHKIYMKRPLDFVQDTSLVFRLHHYLYGLKQALWGWYDNIDGFFLSYGFIQSTFKDMEMVF